MTTSRRETSAALVPLREEVAGPGELPELREWAEQLVERARGQGIELTGDCPRVG